MTGRSWLTRAAQVRRTTRIAAAVTLLLAPPCAWNLATAPWTGRLAAQGTRPAGPTDRPDDTRFSVVTVVPMGELDEPLTFAVANDGRVFINERRTGHIKVYNPRGNTTTIVGTMIYILLDYFASERARPRRRDSFSSRRQTRRRNPIRLGK